MGRPRDETAPSGRDRHAEMPERDGIAERHLEGRPERTVLQMPDEREERARFGKAAGAPPLGGCCGSV